MNNKFMSSWFSIVGEDSFIEKTINIGIADGIYASLYIDKPRSNLFIFLKIHKDFYY